MGLIFGVQVFGFNGRDEVTVERIPFPKQWHCMSRAEIYNKHLMRARMVVPPEGEDPESQANLILPSVTDGGEFDSDCYIIQSFKNDSDHE